MTAASNKEGRLLTLISAALVVVIFVLDLLVPLGYTVTLAYTALLILFLKGRNSRHVLLFSIAATVLIVAAVFLKPEGDISIAIFNRVMTIVTLWFTTFFVIQYFRSENVTQKTADQLGESTRAEKALRESQNFLMTLAKNFPSGSISVLDKDLNFVFVEGRDIQDRGIDSAQIIGMNLRSRLTPEDYEAFREPIDTAFKGEVSKNEIFMRDRHYINYVVPIPDDAGNIDRIMMVSQNITERKKAEEEMINALQKERQVNELKSRFVSMASHEFRTPLATVLSSVALIARYNKPEDEEKRMKHINRIKSSVSNLTQILEEFLSLGKLEEGRVANVPETIDIQEFATDITEELQMTAKAGQSIHYSHYGVGAMVRVDKQLLRNVLFNLLSNAIKYSPENREIIFETIVKDNELEINITDHGIGIPDDDQMLIFSTFYRAQNVTNIEGTGLGLNIVKKYVELMNGEISFVSELNKGTTFTVKIPQA
jgi:PAS domain S-box-containing protein